MSSNRYSVLHTPAGLTTPITDISDMINISETEGIRSSADSFSFTLQLKTKYQNFFNDGDRIKIYFASGSTKTDDGLVMDGVIKEINYSGTLDRQTITIQGQNILEILLNAPVPTEYSNATNANFNTSPKAIKNIVNQATGLNKNAKYTLVSNIYAELRSVDLVNGKIDDISTPGGNILKTFPVSYGRTQTPSFQLIEELSTWKWTGLPIDIGTYIYYLDTSNRFHWEPRSNTVQGGINVGDYTDIKINKTIFDVINYAIINCGKDFKGHSITTYVFRPNYMTKGIKGKYFVFEELAQNRRGGQDDTHANGTYDKTNGDPDNDHFRLNVQNDGRAKGESILQVFGAPRFQVIVTMKGTTAFYKGNLYSINVPGFFRDQDDKVVSSMNLRLRDVSHSFTSKGWETTLTLLQDELTVTGA
jgi:hypothetical protein